MTTSELTNFEQQNQKEIDKTNDLLFISSQKKLFSLKVVEYLLLAAFFSAGIFVIFYSSDKTVVTVGIISLTISFFLLLINRELVQNVKKSINQSEIIRKAQLYTYVLNNNSGNKNTAKANLTRGKALQYCQDLIDDYKKVRSSARNLYYGLQIATVILSGVTPILVLVDKLEAGQAWLK